MQKQELMTDLYQNLIDEKVKIFPPLMKANNGCLCLT